MQSTARTEERDKNILVKWKLADHKENLNKKERNYRRNHHKSTYHLFYYIKINKHKQKDCCGQGKKNDFLFFKDHEQKFERGKE